MNRPDSDLDIFECYLAPSEDFLVGKQHLHCHFSQTESVDHQSAELGTVVKQLLANNFNYYVNVFSPIVIDDWEDLGELRRLAEMNISKKAFHSIYGLGMSNYRKYLVNVIQADKGDIPKRCRIIARSVKFGIKLLEEGKIEFNPVGETSVKEVEQLLERLKEAEKNSSLPDEPQHPEALYDFLLKIRLKELKK
jgi:predicted nucleotidyltransferase